MSEIEVCEIRFDEPEKVAKIKEKLHSKAKYLKMSDFFKVFSDSTRLQIVNALSLSKMCVCDLSNLLEMNQSAISHQLRVLRQNNLVKYEKKGKRVFYSLSDDHIKVLFNTGLEHIEETFGG